MSKAAELAALIANVNKGSSLGNKNLVINGAMTVAQRGTSEASITSSKYANACDRWKMNGNNGTWTASQDTNAPDGFSNSYKFVLTATETIGSTSYMEIEQRMEGQHLQQLSYGTSDAKTITLSFYVKSNITGTYCANLYQDDGSKNYPKTYTINSADTWEYKTLSFVGNTSTALDNDTAISMRTIFFMVAGSGLTSGSAGSRVAYSDATFAAGHSAQIDAVNDYFQITGVQLEIGEKATEFEHEPFETTLSKCHRYYQEVSIGAFYLNGLETDYVYRSHLLPVKPRATPTIAVHTQFQYYSGGTAANFTPTFGVSGDGLAHQHVVVFGSSLTNANGLYTGTFSADAEL